LIDRIGRLKILWAGSIVMVLTSFAFLLLSGTYQQMKYWMACILFLRGSAFAAFYTAFFTYIADLSSPENRARIIGYFGISGLAAHGCAPRTAELVLQHWGFMGFFVASALLALLSVLISAFLKEKMSFGRSEEGGLQMLKNVTFSRANLVFLPGAFFFGYILASFNTFGAAYFQAIHAGSAGYFFLMYGGCAAGVRALLGGLADRFTRWKLITFFFALLGAGVCFLIMRNLPAFYLLSAALCGTAHGILFPSMSAMAVDAHPAKYRGLVTSVYTGAIELGFSLGSYLLGVVIAIADFNSMFLSVAAVGFAFSIYVWIAGFLNLSRETSEKMLT
jgi:MFS family permease